jgi:hypothetical protein
MVLSYKQRIWSVRTEASSKGASPTLKFITPMSELSAAILLEFCSDRSLNEKSDVGVLTNYR